MQMKTIKEEMGAGGGGEGGGRIERGVERNKETVTTESTKSETCTKANAYNSFFMKQDGPLMPQSSVTT